MFHWEYRTVIHVDPKMKETYLSVHEFYIENGEYTGYTQDPSSPSCKKDLEWMTKAFNRNPVVEVDDSTCDRDEYGFVRYGTWRWLEKKPA